MTQGITVFPPAAAPAGSSSRAARLGTAGAPQELQNRAPTGMTLSHSRQASGSPSAAPQFEQKRPVAVSEHAGQIFDIAQAENRRIRICQVRI
jgi:hypothetical protein